MKRNSPKLLQLERIGIVPLILLFFPKSSFVNVPESHNREVMVELN